MANDLNAPTIADGQADGQWQTSNDADAAIANALSDLYGSGIDFSAGNVTLSATQYRSAMVFKPSAALAAARTLILPAVKRPFIFHNSDATYTVTLKSTDGASPETALTKAVAPGELFYGYTNGSSPGLYGASVSTSGGGGVSDGDKGDITVSSSGTVWTIDVMQGAIAGNILAYDSASPAGWVKVPPGTSGQFLESQGGAAPIWGNPPYDIPLSFSGTPTAGQLIGKVVVARDVSFPANFSGSAGHIGTNPTSTFAIDVQDNGVSIGTISISTGGVFTFSTASGTAKTVSSGHRIEFYAPANSPADATAANIAATLKGTAI